MKFKKLSLLLIPLLLSGCNENIESEQYQAINNQQDVMKETYRLHKLNQSYLSTYSYDQSISYDSTYDIFGELVFGETIPLEARNLYYDHNVSTKINIYSGYFISKTSENEYIGNKDDAGSKKSRQYATSLWFSDFEEPRENSKEMIIRNENSENGIAANVKDMRTGISVANNQISHYFSNNINTRFETYFPANLAQPSAEGNKQIVAYNKSSTEIVETTHVTDDSLTIQNPIHPGNEYRLTVLKTTNCTTTFKRIDRIGWVGTEHKEETIYSLMSDYELKLLSSPRVIRKETMKIAFAYSASIQPYSGESFVIQNSDPKIELYWPHLYTYDVENDLYEEVVVGDSNIKNITAEYKRLNPSFNGYAFSFESVVIEEGKHYCFATSEDIGLEEPVYESIGFSNISENILGTIVSSKINEHNLFKTITDDTNYQFIVLFSQSGSRKVIVRIIN